jgi:uncharacterized membrane protein
MSQSSTSNRPFGVGFLSLLIIIIGALQLGGGIALLIERNNSEVLDSLDATSSNVTAVAIAAIVSSVVAIIVGLALRGGASWARVLVAVLAVANLAALIYAASSSHHLHWYNVVWSAVLYALIAGYLFFDDDAKAYFR